MQVQRAVAPEHGEFYALAGELVDTLRSLTDLVTLLAGQVSRYGHGRVLRDDEAGHDPAGRLDTAWTLAAQVGDEVGRAEGTAGRFWSTIGHLGLEPPATPEGPAPDGPTGIDPTGDPS